MAFPATPVFGYATGYPTNPAEFHQLGELLINAEPAPGQAFAWVCVASGNPGTWTAISEPLHAAAEFNATVTITPEEIAALRGTPKTLVPAPGAGYMLEFVYAELFLDYTSPGFTESSDNLAIKYNDGSGSAVSETIECTGFIDQTADTKIGVKQATSAALAKTSCENKALVLHNTGDGEFGNDGGSTLRVNITYRVVPTGW